MASYRITDKTKTDCFAFAENKCKALKERYCDREECPFYKDEKTFKVGFNPDDLKVYSQKKNNDY